MPEPATDPATIHFHSPTPVLSVADLNVSVDYYARALGFSMEFIMSGIIACMSRGECSLFLVEGDQGHPGTWVWIGVSDSAALYEEFKASGAKIRVPPTNRPWAYEMQVEDPDGHVLRFGSDQKRNEPLGEWLDMHGTRWTPLPQGRWKQSDQLTDADRVLQGAAEAWRAHKKDEVRSALEKAVEMWRQKSGSDADAQVELAIALRTLAEFERNTKNPDAARGYYEEAVSLLREAKDPLRLAHAVRHLGDIHQEAKRPAEAEACYAESLALYRQDGKLRPLDIGNVLRRLAIVKEETGDNAAARDLWQQAFASYEGTGFPPALAESAAWIARLAHRLGDRAAAQDWLKKAEAAAIHCEEDSKEHVGKVREELG